MSIFTSVNPASFELGVRFIALAFRIEKYKETLPAFLEERLHCRNESAFHLLPRVDARKVLLYFWICAHCLSPDRYLDRPVDVKSHQKKFIDPAVVLINFQFCRLSYLKGYDIFLFSFFAEFFCICFSVFSSFENFLLKANPDISFSVLTYS